MIKKISLNSSQKDEDDLSKKKEKFLNSPTKALRSCEEIMLDIQEVKENALSEGDYKTALKAIELEGKQLALLCQSTEVKGNNSSVPDEKEEEMSSKIKDFLASLHP